MSQLGADDWVLSMFPRDYEGFYVDVGCGDGSFISNTEKLENNNWKGICIDAIPRNFSHRKCQIVNAVVYSEKDIDVDFIIARDNDYSSIKECLGVHKNVVLNSIENVIRMKTSLLQDILEQYECPSVIDYMNLDIEGAEYEVLKVFPFDKYKIHCLSVEHNYEQPKTNQIDMLLKEKGYKFYRQVKWDNWYILDENF